MTGVVSLDGVFVNISKSKKHSDMSDFAVGRVRLNLEVSKKSTLVFIWQAEGNAAAKQTQNFFPRITCVCRYCCLSSILFNSTLPIFFRVNSDIHRYMQIQCCDNFTVSLIMQ